MWRRLGPAVFLILTLPGWARAQQPSTAATPAPGAAAASAPTARNVRGTVTDSLSHRPVARAAVTLVEAGRTTFTDTTGAFAFDSVDAAGERVRMERLGYVMSERPVGADTTALAVAVMPRPQLLAYLDRLDKFLWRQRRRSSVAKVYDWRDLSAATQPDLRPFLLRTLALQTCPAGVAGRCAMVRGEPLPVEVRIDGMPAPGGLDDLLNYRPKQLLFLTVDAQAFPVANAYTIWWLEKRLQSGSVSLPELPQIPGRF